MNFQISPKDIESITNAFPEAIERVLKVIQDRINNYAQYNPQKSSVGSDQGTQKGSNFHNPSAMTHQNVQNTHPYPINKHIGNQNDILREKDETIHELRETLDVIFT